MSFCTRLVVLTVVTGSFGVLSASGGEQVVCQWDFSRGLQGWVPSQTARVTPGRAEANTVQAKWRSLLTEAGYQRVVFLRANGGMQINGLPLLASGG